MPSSITKRNAQDNFIEQLIIVSAVCVLLVFLLHKDSTLFFQVWKILMLPVARIVAFLSSTDLGHLINGVLGHTQNQADTLVLYLRSLSPAAMTWRQCQFISHFLGIYFLFFFLPLGSYLFFLTYRLTQGVSEPYHRFKNVAQLKRYAKTTTPAASMTGLEKKCALSPLEFATQHELIIRDKKNVIISLEKEKANSIFCQQLGNKFHTLECLINHKLYGAIAMTLLQAIPPEDRNNISTIISGHLYDTTVIMGLLCAARRGGVVPLIPFLQLQITLPALWYALASMGRNTFFIEGAGIMAQFYYEMECKKAKRVAQDSQVDAAIAGLGEVIFHKKRNKVQQ